MPVSYTLSYIISYVNQKSCFNFQSQISGYMTREEKKCLESIKTDVNLYWLPGLWFTKNLQEALRQGHVRDAYGAQLIMQVGDGLMVQSAL